MSNKAKLLVVDDDNAHRNMLCTLLQGWGYACSEAVDGLDALEKVRENSYDLVISDVRMARMDGIECLQEILQYNPALPVIIMTAWSSVEKAVAALKLGAYDYLTKPLDFELLKIGINKALSHKQALSENKDLKQKLNSQNAKSSMIIGQSQAMRELIEMIETIAPTEANVLITGESGTGKELVARAIQANSNRASEAFVTINCAALSESLLESELFGHEKGAFTGADKRRDGRFVQANKGTLFLDEIGELPISLQAKLLRALQQGEVQRVGSDTPIIVDVRLIAATNRDLKAEVQAGRFREDLYYRLNVITLEIAPLRSRREDIAELAQYFLLKHAESNKKKLQGFSAQAMDCLIKYDFPGNVRELENAIERAVILSFGDFVRESSFPSVIREVHSLPESPEQKLSDDAVSLEDLEKNAIIKCLKECQDNKSECARRLGITRATLHNKLKRYDLE